MANETAYLHMVHPPSRVFTGVSQGTITAGMFVKGIDNDDAVSAESGYAPVDIKVDVCDAAGDDELCLGIALTDAASGVYVGVAMDGVFVVKSSGDLGAGIALQQDDSGSSPASVKAVGDGEEEYKIAKSLTSASDDAKYMVIALNV